MPTWYCKPVGAGKTGGTGLSLSEAFNGWADLFSRGMALTAAGDTIALVGAFTLREYTYNTYTPNSTTAAIASNSWYGPRFGTNFVSTSNASGRIFDLRGCAIDMRGATLATQRMSAALTIQGEGITMLAAGCRIYPSNWNYLFDETTGATRVPWAAPVGTGDNTLAEQVSWENGGLILAGNGNTLDGLTVQGAEGGSGWCRHAIMMYVTNAGVANSTAGLTNEIKTCKVSGCLTGISATTNGSGSTLLAAGQVVDVHHNECTSPVWGWPAGRPFSEYDLISCIHGNALEFVGQFAGRGAIHHNRVTGPWQDGIDLGAAGQADAYSNYVDLAGMPNVLRRWKWDATLSKWWLDYTTSIEGNGIKLGLTVYSGTGAVAPTTWQGSDGTVGSTSLQSTEQGNRAYRNTLLRCAQQGISSNAGNGCYIAANEIIDCRGCGINLFASTTGNHCVENNYVKMADTGVVVTGFGALHLQANQRIVLLNNILDAGASAVALGNFDIYMAAGTTALAKSNNVLVTGRTGGSVPADTVAIASPGSLAWVQGEGLPAGHAYYTAGKADAWRFSRMAASGVCMHGRPLGAAVGPFSAALSRSVR